MPRQHEEGIQTDNACPTVGTWFAFKKVFRKKAEKMERTNLTYGAMAKLCRDGGFWVRSDPTSSKSPYKNQH